MKISHKWLQTYFRKPLPSSEEIANLLTFHIFEVEGIEKKADDDILDVKVLPDRASYCLCHEGIARELAGLLTGNEFVPRQIAPIEVSEDVASPVVSVEAGDMCDAYNLVRIMNVSKTQSPEWLVKMLAGLGQRSINLFADLSNFVTFDIGAPMHVFDALKVSGGITVRYARAGEKLTTLDNKEIVLDSNIAIIADDKTPLAIAGIKGGKQAETGHLTNHILVEAAHFDAQIVRKTSAKIGIKTDSSKRFENEVGHKSVQDAISYFVQLLKKEDPEIIVGPIASAGVSTEHHTKIEIHASFISQKIGKSIREDEVIDILKRVGINARREGEIIAVYPDENRKDLVIVEDIVDEVGRLYGYENIEPRLPEVHTVPVINQDIQLRNKVRNFLVERGFSEIQTYTMVEKGEIEILSPLADDKKFLRTNLSDHMVKKLVSNLYYADLLGQSKIRIFEFGRVWRGGRELMSLAIGVSHKKQIKDMLPKDEIKAVRDELFAHLGVNVNILCTIDDTGGLINRDGKNIGVTNQNEGVMEVDFEDLVSGLPAIVEPIRLISMGGDIKYKKPSEYPFMVRDVAVFVPGTVENTDKVWTVIERNASDLVVRHELFDVFEKKSKETGIVEKTSFAFRLVFQSYDKTLTDEEVNRIMDKVYDALKSQGWEIR